MVVMGPSTSIFFGIALVCAQVYSTASADQEDASESDLRRQLFENYDKLVRPVKDPKKPLSVSFSISPLALAIVNVEERSMVMDSWMTVVWKDEYLSWNPEEWNGIERLNLPISEIWSPDLSTHAALSDYAHFPTEMTNVVIRSDGEVLWVPPFSIHNRCPKFEFGSDSLQCTISVSSWSYDVTQLDLNIHGDTKENLIHFDDTLSAWTLEDMLVSKELISFDCCPEPFSTLHFHITVKKR